MKLKNALIASTYHTATLEYNNLYTTIDGSIGDGSYDIKTGVQGMPVQKTQTVGSLDEALKMASNEELDTNGWIPIGENGEPQE